jgi:hypothetical protein
MPMDEASAKDLLDVVLYEAVADNGVDKLLNIPLLGLLDRCPQSVINGVIDIAVVWSHSALSLGEGCHVLSMGQFVTGMTVDSVDI